MPIAYEGDVAAIVGAATIEEAEGLLAFLRSAQDPVVDVTNALRVHTAIAQILRASHATFRGAAQDVGLAACLDRDPKHAA
ncbi:hypothetical protein [Blastochloris tepida]|uniref:Uncharacterized protein n=1 Tax=Blastochloris tepida TaxID=2233851 RepID=A0A348FXC4_9HYPH|nr:hypothetical protein [Blastochloris tepida]BBF91957.1 hypothetical protein BLTE_06420 [Blastochloris tepida]